ncbi:peptidoglycan DD-metalloendopeptidase family protein [Chelativorans intermedius]|uniref:Peptidoglycan DD-metalloendopeptidase family protein n=1 Tax=Chelativorans intermedius TaxID=515947 RepID=A0ABV6D5B8_9HYPH|nr:peptidoglycan DD-metalloendopeptidase family protein [Chelativorans intermedius]MCT8997127.1 peptidoglycan DD-metalloendopeptidase family protein [Chelativorans intermedius]
MRFGITGHHRNLLARGAAVLVVGAVAAGCTSGAASLDDGLVTNSTTASAPVTVAQADQPYPGDMPQGRRSAPEYDKIVRPKVPVGGGSVQNRADAPLPPPSGPGYAAAPASQPVRQDVSSQPLPPPAQAPQPVQAAALPDTRGGTSPAPQPVEPPQAQVAVLPQAPKPAQRTDSRTDNAAPSPGSTYTVVSGDTLYGISRKTGVSVERIKQANGLSDGMIRVGQTLTIPAAGASVAAAEPVERPTPAPSRPAPVTKVAASSQEQEKPRVVSAAPPVQEEESAGNIEEATEVAAIAPDATGVGRLRWPVQGRVVTGFGSGNDGIDIAVPEGTPVRAAENGVVIYSGDGLKGFGNTVLVRHEDGLVTVYGHASSLKVKRGDNVRRGQEIALSGMSGDADRPKLHFEVRKGTSPVDPMRYLE